MAFRRHVGFLKEDELEGVDSDFRELVRLSYQISGFGSYGVSCSGHFYPDYSDGRFYPVCYASLSVATLPEMPHIPELLRLIHETTQTDPDTQVGIKDKKKPPIDFDRYLPSMNLRPYSFGETKDGLYVALLEIRLGSNGCLDLVPDHRGAPIELEGNQEVFEKSQKRYLEIKEFWERLEDRVRNYNLEHGFSETDFMKREFKPFR